MERNIKRLREMLGIKQDSLAIELNITQAAISKLESKEEIEKDTLEKIAKILKLPVEAIENFSDEGALNFVANTIETFHYTCTFNPIDKIMNLYSEKEELYQKMLEAEKEKILTFILF